MNYTDRRCWRYLRNPPKRPGRCYFHFINVGVWGSGILIETPQVNVLVDVCQLQGTDQVEECLIDRGVNKLDLLILTHPHKDHIGYGRGGVSRFLDHYDVQEIWSVGQPCPNWYNEPTTPWPPGDSGVIYSEVLSQIFPSGYTVAPEGQVPNIVGVSVVPYKEPRMGDAFSIGDLVIKILHPSSDISTDRGLNEQSMSIQVCYGNTKVILDGDCTRSSHDRILEHFTPEELKSDVLCLSHHGLYDATYPMSWLTNVDPMFATVQNASGTIHSNTYSRLVERRIPLNDPRIIGHTVTAETDGNNISVLNNDYNWKLTQ